MENILLYIISFNNFNKNYYYSLLSSGILNHDIRGYYLDAELLDYDVRDSIDKLRELYGIEIIRIWMPDGFYCLEYDPGFGREIWVYEDDINKIRLRNRGIIVNGEYFSV